MMMASKAGNGFYRLFLLLLATATLNHFQLGGVDACSCLEFPTVANGLQSEYNQLAVHANIKYQLPRAGDTDPNLINDPRYYFARIFNVFKGDDCFQMDSLKGQNVMFVTGGNSALCGVILQSSTKYLLFGSINEQQETYTMPNGNEIPLIRLGSCSYLEEFKKLSKPERRMLRRHKKCQCSLNDPCGLPPPGAAFTCPDGTIVGSIGPCEYNFETTRCNWGPGPECPPCTKSEDCGLGQYYCAAGECRAYGTCTTDTDCRNPFHNWQSELDCAPSHNVCNMDRNECDLDCTCGCPLLPPIFLDPDEEYNEEEDYDEKDRCVIPVNCFDDPCRTYNEGKDPRACEVKGAVCVSDYCNGGCGRIFWAPDGTQVCQGFPIFPPL